MKFPHWQYFIALESSLSETTRYVELAEANYTAFSIEYARILLSTASEVDVVCKLICNQESPSSKAENIDTYRKIILANYPNFPNIKIQIPYLESEITPWDSWNSNNNPDWWRSYNKVKHERGNYFKEANLKNALYALGGLFAVLLYLYQPDTCRGNLYPFPKLLNYEGFPTISINDTVVELPDFPRKKLENKKT